MHKFITIRCKSCGAVIFNLPEKQNRKLKFVDLICEDCIDHNALENYGMETNSLDHSKNAEMSTQI